MADLGTRQTRRAKERRDVKIERAQQKGLRYPPTKYRPASGSGEVYSPNGKRECARRVRQMEGHSNG